MGQSSYKCNAYVIAGLGYSVVLGRDFLEQSRAIIDLGALTVVFFGHNVIPFLDRKGPSTPLPEHCGKTQVIDAHSEAVIPATVATASSIVIGLVEPKGKTSRKPGSNAEKRHCTKDDVQVSDHRIKVTDITTKDTVNDEFKESENMEETKESEKKHSRASKIKQRK